MGKLNWRNKAFVLFFLWAATAFAVPAQTAPVTSAAPVFTTLHNFDQTGGSAPYGALVQGANGELYGTTEAGGIGQCDAGCGTVFKITTSGALKTIYSFCMK